MMPRIGDHVPVPGERVEVLPVIAIDGPMAAGKSTVAQLLARRLGFQYVDTGAMYRSVAWAEHQQGIDIQNEGAVAALAQTLRLEFLPTPEGQRVRVNGVDVTEAIRTPEISDAASVVSTYPAVREAMVRLQRDLGARGGVVMEGRDIGTVVFPNATLKIYLDATPEVRVRRRYEELRAKGTAVALEALAQAEAERDRRDVTRGHSPLRPAPDAIVIDTTRRSVEAIVEQILTLLRERK